MKFCSNPKCFHHIEVPDGIRTLNWQPLNGELHRATLAHYRLEDGTWVQVCNACCSAYDYMCGRHYDALVKSQNTGLSGGTPSAAVPGSGGES